MSLVESSKNVVYYKGHKYSSIQRLHKIGNMHGVKRVVVFCVMTTILPTLLIITPLYLRHIIFADVTYHVTEPDVIAITDGISSIFCQSQILKMNYSFNAFQLNQLPEISPNRRHIRLKKSMTLPDDSLEYWGFFLLKGATVSMKVCSRYEGSRILVVRGNKHLNTCRLLDHNRQKFGATMDADYKQVKVYFEHAQEIHDSTTYKKKDTNNGGEVEDVAEFVKERLNKSKKRLESDNLVINDVSNHIDNENDTNTYHLHRHSKKRIIEMQERLYRLQESLKSNEDIDFTITRQKRDQLLDGPIEHGGNAMNFTKSESNENSVSSFETDLLTCYDGSILLAQGFNPSELCNNVQYLEKGEHMETVHEVVSNGYYYYIFYSDNDFITNDIHAVFDIYKPTFQYTNNTKDKECINTTECSFPIKFFSGETVIVEIPNGIENENYTVILTSTCYPRMSIYIIFPIAVMFLILGCAFL